MLFRKEVNLKMGNDDTTVQTPVTPVADVPVADPGAQAPVVPTATPTEPVMEQPVAEQQPAVEPGDPTEAPAPAEQQPVVEPTTSTDGM